MEEGRPLAAAEGAEGDGVGGRLADAAVAGVEEPAAVLAADGAALDVLP